MDYWQFNCLLETNMRQRFFLFVIIILMAFVPQTRGQAQSTPTITPIAYGQTVTGQIKTTRDLAIYAFSGVKGDMVTITVTSTTKGFQPAIDLTDEHGNSIATSTSTHNSIDDQELTKTGIY